MNRDQAYRLNKNHLKRKPLFLLALIGAFCFSAIKTSAQSLPEGFVYLNAIDSTISIELRYFTHDNFVGAPVDGYAANVLILTAEAATALAAVQQEVLKDGFSLKVFDAYRPQRAVDRFMRWTEAASDTLTKAKYYPNISKDSLVPQGYISGKKAVIQEVLPST